MDFGKHHWIYIYMLVHVMILVEGRDNEERPGMRTEDLKAYIIELEPERKQVEINKPFGNEGIINSDSGEVDGKEQIPVTWLAAMRHYVSKVYFDDNTKLPVANGQWIGRPKDHLNDTASLTEPKSKGSMHGHDPRKTSIEESENVNNLNAKAKQEGNDGARRKRSLFDIAEDIYDSVVGTVSETVFGRRRKGNGGGPTKGNVDVRTSQ